MGGDQVRDESIAPARPVNGYRSERSTIHGAVFGSDYRASTVLKGGQLVETLLGTDLRDGSAVVIKTAPATAVSCATWMRLQHDVEALGRIDARSFAPPVRLGREGSSNYLVTPFLPGVTLEERIAAGRLNVDQAIAVGRGVLQALQAAHGCGVLHRNVKPANVILDDDGLLHRASLIDFGLSRSALMEPPLEQQLLQAARYASPEQAGILGRATDERSDLYSTGILLFECLAGRPPFEAETIGELLRLHLTSRTPALRDLGVNVPRALDEFVHRLLGKDPRERYQSAESALADLLEIDAARRRGVDDPALVVGLHDVRSALVEPALVGRDKEFALLDAQLEAALRGEGGLVVLEAESGGGKTRLLDELAHRAARAGAWVLRGQGVDQAATRPFPVAAGIAQDIVSRTSMDPDVMLRIRKSLGDLQGSVCAALPELGEVLESQGNADLGPEAFAEMRILEGLARLLDSLGSSEQPALVILDDCQWSGTLTATLLERWHRSRASGGGRYVVVVVAFRSEEVGSDHALRRLGATTELILPPLPDCDVERLAETMAGELPDQARSTVVRLSHGNPFMASAVLRGLVESGALVDEPLGWRVDPQAMACAQSSGEAAAFLARRLELLAEGALRLLAAAAVLGKEFDLDLAAELAGLSPSEAVSAVEQARRRDIVWAVAHEPSYAFVHDKVREAVLARLGGDDRRRLHRLAALHLLQRNPERVFDLAYHFDAAGERERAFPFALDAAAQARARYALEAAEEQYRIAEGGAETADVARRLALAEGLGDVLMLQGHYDAAERQFAIARSLAADRVTEAGIEGKVGELRFKRGEVASAGEALEGALRLLGQTIPGRRSAFVVRGVFEAAVQLMHTLLPKVLVGRRGASSGEADLLAARLYSRLAHVYWFQRGRLPTLWSHLRGMNLAERYPPSSELAQAYSEHAPAMTMVPNFRRGIVYAEKSLAIRRKLGDRWGEGQSLHFYGVVLYAASDFEQCIARCREAVKLLERTGDRWELNAARSHIAFAHYRRGELAEAVDVARSLYRDGVEIGNGQASGISLGAWAKATGGRVPAETIERELARSVDDVQMRAEVLQAKAVRLIGSGRPGEAAEVLEDAWRLVRRKGLRQEYVSPILPWLATALRLEAERTPLSAPRRRNALLRRARAAARRGRRLARSYRNNLPHASRELALAHAARGRTGRAQLLFDQSLREAQSQGARFEYLQTLLARGCTGQDLDWPMAPEQVAEAERGLGVLRAAPIQQPGGGFLGRGLLQEPITLSLADRFDTLLDAGRRITSALTREAIFATVRDAAETLLRGESCFVMAIPAGGGVPDIAVVAGGGERGIDESFQAMALQAIATGETRVFSFEGGRADSPENRFATAGVRSALCAPISVRGRAAGCFYVEHRTISGLFGEEERRVAGFIATLAGAALENADGLAAAEDLASSLKNRTSELEQVNRRLDDSVKELTDAYERERQIASQLNHMAFHDSLTNLANRVLLTESLEHAIKRAQRLRSGVAVLFLDLDDFKTINDSLGHAVGDELLIAVAQRLRACLRDADMAARISGDEFAILLEDIGDPSDAARSAERILASLQPPLTLAGTEVFVRASIGIALGPSGQHPGQSAELLRNADMAMYMAKNEKKGGYRFFAPGMHAGLLQRLELKADLERALGHGDFTIHYQPIVDLETGKIDGLEALIRWRHPTRGLVHPALFLPLAEETGLVRPVGHWVLHQACRQAARWQASAPDGRPLTLSVNLSPSELHEPELVEEVATALHESGLSPGSLILELTESVFLRDTEATMERLRGLKQLGVKLAIDDFGTGYSSLGYLRRFPLDRIKVAKQFVDDVAKGDEESALTRAIVKLGEAFELETVAEGIEHAAQLEQLREIGCRLGQGHYFAEALSVEDIDPLLTGDARFGGLEVV